MSLPNGPSSAASRSTTPPRQQLSSLKYRMLGTPSPDSSGAGPVLFTKKLKWFASAMFLGFAGLGCVYLASSRRAKVTNLRKFGYSLLFEEENNEPQCKAAGEDCRLDRCCLEKEHRCYLKNKDWAQCQLYCTKGIDKHDHVGYRTPWQCTDITVDVEKKYAATPTVDFKLGHWDHNRQRIGHRTLNEKKNDKFFLSPSHRFNNSRARRSGEKLKRLSRNELKIYNYPKIDYKKFSEGDGEDSGSRSPITTGYMDGKGSSPSRNISTEGSSARRVQQDPWMSETNFRFDSTSTDLGVIPNSEGSSPFPSTTSSTTETLDANIGYKLFCFMVIRVDSYEADLVRTQYENEAGIFKCDHFIVFSDKPMKIGSGASTQEIGSLDVAGEAVRTHFANSNAFARVYSYLRWIYGVEKLDDFVVKVDPDTVFLPWRLVTLLRSAGVSSISTIYFKNCHFQDKLWMFGALEVMTKAAILSYFERWQEVCVSQLDFDHEGEDTFLAECFDLLGVQNYMDAQLLSDGYCNEAPGLCDNGKVAFHPFKHPMAFLSCWREAIKS